MRRIEAMTDLNSHIEKGSQSIGSNIGRKSHRAEFKPDRNIDQRQGDKSKNRDSTTDCSTMSSVKVFEDKREKGIVVTMPKQKRSKITYPKIFVGRVCKMDTTVAEKLRPLETSERANLEGLRHGGEILIGSLHEFE